MLDDNKMIELHFSECWDENIWIYEEEAREWLEELHGILADNTMSIQRRLQKVIDEITTTM